MTLVICRNKEVEDLTNCLTKINFVQNKTFLCKCHQIFSTQTSCGFFGLREHRATFLFALETSIIHYPAHIRIIRFRANCEASWTVKLGKNCSSINCSCGLNKHTRKLNSLTHEREVIHLCAPFVSCGVCIDAYSGSGGRREKQQGSGRQQFYSQDPESADAVLSLQMAPFGRPPFVSLISLTPHCFTCLQRPSIICATQTSLMPRH